MELNNINLIYFSPTHTSAKVAHSISKGMNPKSEIINDLTYPLDEKVQLTNDDFVIFSFPVYGGRLPALALKRLEQVVGNETPCVINVTYGNRDYEDALIELKDAVIELGFIPIAGSAFIGEHSFSTQVYPIAVNRPNKDDLKVATNFGENILSHVVANDITSDLKVKGNRPYKKLGKSEPASPQTIEDLCTQCGHCIEICPSEAIYLDDEIETHADQCIMCCACVKECPNEARIFETPFSKYLYDNFSVARQPELFL